VCVVRFHGWARGLVLARGAGGVVAVLDATALECPHRLMDIDTTDCFYCFG